MRPLVSIVVPCYNCRRFLDELLLSIRNLSYENYECIIVDDGSTDETFLVKDSWIRYDKRYTYVYQKNSGVSAARNTGFNISKGNYIYFIDADDLLSSDKISSDITLAESSGADFIFGRWKYFSNDISNTYDDGFQKIKPDDILQNDLLSLLMNRNVFVVGAVLVKRTFIIQTGVFDVHMKRLEDWDFWIRCAIEKNRKFVFNPSASSLVFIRNRAGSLSKSSLMMRRFQLRLILSVVKKNQIYCRMIMFGRVSWRTSFTSIFFFNEAGLQLVNRLMIMVYLGQLSIVYLKHRITSVK